MTDSSETFPTANDGLRGVPIRITETDDGSTQDAIIAYNTATTLTFQSAISLGAGPYTYSIGFIDGYVVYPWLSLGDFAKWSFVPWFRFHHKKQTHSGVLSQEWFLDQAETSSLTQTLAMNTTPPFGILAPKLRCQLLKLRQSNVEPDQPWEVFQQALEYRLRGVRR